MKRKRAALVQGSTKSITAYTSPISQDMEQNGREILAELYISLLSTGQIETNGKSEDQLYLELVQRAKEWSERRPMRMSRDFRPGLLKQARSLKRRNQLNEASLYYGTWFEHWINSFFDRKAHRLDESEFRQMIRDVNLRGKFTWLLALVVGWRIPEKHLRAVIRVCDLRNEFVHYKWKPVDFDKSEDELEQLRQAHRAAESAIRYLQEFETRHLFKGAARRLLKNLRYTRHDRTNKGKGRTRKRK
jgi:hypothetical protein